MFKHALFFLASAGITVTLASAQQVADLQEMAKWASAQVVHYHIEGQYQSWTHIDESQSTNGADVTDRLILDFDFQLLQGSVAGTVKFQNVKSTLKNLGSGPSCPAPVLKGDFEYFDAKEATVEGGVVKVKGTRSFPAADLATQCPEVRTVTAVAAKQAPVEATLVVEHPVKVLLGGANSSDTKVAADKKSFTVQNGSTNWAWTYTPTIVK